MLSAWMQADAPTDGAMREGGFAMTPAQAAERLPQALAMQDWETARKALKRLVRVDPGNASLHYNLGLVLRRLGDPDAADDAFGAALKLSPGHLNALFERAAAAMDAGRWEAAEAGFSAYLEKAPDDADGWLNLARLRLRRDAAGEAEAAFARVLALRPGDRDAEIGLAEAGLRQGRAEAAAKLRTLFAELPAERPRLLKAMSQGPRGKIPLSGLALTGTVRIDEAG